MIREGFLKNVEIKKQLGKGHYGSVYLLEKNNEKEAMKVIDIFPKNAESNMILGISNQEELENITSQLMEEISILYSLKGDTHIVNYIDHYIEKSEEKYSLYLEMEFLQSLSTYYDDQMDSHQILTLCHDLLEGLVICENNQIIHGDIKPENIMVDDQGHHKLTDFGIAKIMNENNKVKGSTPVYASPEVIQEGKYTKQSDIYSLGLVIYQMFNDGLLPFMKKNDKKKNIEKSIQKRIDKDIPKPKGIDETFYAFLKKALAKKPEDRFQNAQDMKEQLIKLQEGKHIPEIVLSLSTIAMIAMKVSEVNTFALATQSSQAAKGLHMTLKTKIIAGTVAATAVGGTYVFLNQKETVDITKNLQYEVVGLEQAGRIEVTDNTVQLEDVDMNQLIENYEYSKNDNLKNGDKVKITVHYNQEYAKEHHLDVQNTTKEVTVKGLKERYKNKNDIPAKTIKLIHDYALEKLFSKARYHSGKYYVYKKESDYSRTFHMNEETFEIVTTYLQKFKDSAYDKTDTYVILLREVYENPLSGGRYTIRIRYRILLIEDFYKGSIQSKSDVKKHCSDLIVFDPPNRFPESRALDTFKTMFDKNYYTYEKVKYYRNTGLEETLKKYPIG